MNCDNPYPSRRSPIFAENIVATSQPLAAQAGLRMLLAGGNAVDAAIATAIALTVVEPTSNGIGSDAFAIVWDGKELHGLNASGRSPAAWNLEFFRSLGPPPRPRRGWHSVTVPGCVSAWIELHRRFGKLPLENLFAPAIAYARDGFIVSPIVSARWHDAAEIFKSFPDWMKTFAPTGNAPNAGDFVRFPDHARTLEQIAQTKGETFYRGDLAAQIANTSKAAGGLMTQSDLANHQCDWVKPISVRYREVELHEIPPNGQGLAALIALGILGHHDLSRHAIDSPDFFHLQMEAMKLALADAHRYIADAAHMDIAVEELLDDRYLASRAKQIDMSRASLPTFGAVPSQSDTVYLTAADASGMMVSFIQSNYSGFGSGIVVPGTGISMQNRGSGFNLEAGHPNCVAGGKRPFHTIIPAFVTRNGKPEMSFGVMGSPMQAQGHVQMITRIYDYNQDPQTAADAPRWQVTTGTNVLIEDGFPPDVRGELEKRGHQFSIASYDTFGGAQLIKRLSHGYVAGSEKRKDGQSVGF